MTTPIPFPDEIVVHAYLSGSWVDITADVLTDGFTARWGITGNGPMDRIASTGEWKFMLRNADRKYTPGDPNCLTGWKKGVQIALWFVWDTVTSYRFHGWVSSAIPEPDQCGTRRCAVTVLDWIDVATKYTLPTPAIGLNKRADEAITTILADMDFAPSSTNLDTGTINFETVFDSVGINTKAYQELSKLTTSEMGYLYMRHVGTTPSELVFENATHRNGLAALTPFTIDGASQTCTLDNSMSAMRVDDSKIYNQVRVIAYPRLYDYADAWPTGRVLFSLASPLLIGSGETKIVQGAYTDPSKSGARVNGYDMISPVATTDYTMYTTVSGTGTNITADLTVTAVYGTESVTYTLVNGSIKAGYIRLLQARGYGIYTYSPIQKIHESAASIADNGYQPLTIDQKYAQSLYYGDIEAEKILDRYKNPYIEVTSVTCWASRSNNMLGAFLRLDVGDIIRIKEAQTATDGYYVIQGVSFNLHPGKTAGGLIEFTWTVKPANTYTVMSLETATGSNDGIDFGYLPEMCNNTQISMGAFAYPAASTSGYIAANISDDAGWIFGIEATTRKPFLYRKFSDGAKLWTCGTALSLDTWAHIAVTHDGSSYANDPIFYINSEAKTCTPTGTPTGTLNDETGVRFYLGNWRTVTEDWTRPFPGKFRAVKIYDAILDATAISEMYLAFDLYEPTANLIFYGPVVRTADVAHFTDLTLTAEDRVIDAISGSMGAPNDSPITRV